VSSSTPPSHSPDGSSGFRVGQRVRVRPGTVDPDYSDLVLGGWVGDIREIDTTSRPASVLVHWTRSTLEAMHPAYRVRCERDGLDLEEMRLDETDLEPCPEGVLGPEGSSHLETPTQLQPAPLDPEDPTDRIRSIFGLTSDDPLPPLNRETLTHYREFLQKEMPLPLPALVHGETGPEPVLVTRILPVAKEEALRVEVVSGPDRRQIDLSLVECGPNDLTGALIEDYLFWLEEEGSEEDEFYVRPRRAFYPQLPWYSALTFGVAGALIATVEEARSLAWMVAAGFAGVLGLWGCYIHRRNRTEMIGAGYLFTFALCGLAGALLGGVLGPLVAAYLYTIPGAILGTLIALVFGRLARGETKWTLYGVLGGGMVLALWTGVWWAVLGFVLGLLPGAVVGFILLVIFVNMDRIAPVPSEELPADEDRP
jgi:hypothetical protein